MATAAVAQAPGQPRDVVVTGRREMPREAARRFASGITRAVDGQVARRRWPICPAVIGLAPEDATVVADRIREVARAAGAPVGKEACRAADSTVIVSAEPATLLADIRRARPGWFTGLESRQLDRLVGAAGPAWSWQTAEVLNEDGRAMRGSPATSGATAPTQNPSSSLPAAPVLQVMDSSLLSRHTQQAIGASFLLLDARACVGKSPTQIGDYAAMRLLAITKPPEAGSGDTILALFADAALAPAGLTDADAAYLHALYHTPPTDKASTRLEAMAGQMARGSGKSR